MNTDILIVGGGLSGLALADQMERAGRDWQLVEATDRLGGRIYSPDIDGAQFDLGPAWFWPGQPRMAALVERFGLTVFDQFSEGDILFQDHYGSVHRNRGFSSMKGAFRIDGGMGVFIDALAGTLPPEKLMLSAPVSALSHAAGQIHAQVGAEQITATNVVLAIPPRVAAVSIGFSPALPEAALSALNAVPTWMAGQAKIVATFDKPYWRDKGFSGDAMSQRGPMVEIHDASPNTGDRFALFGFVGVRADSRARYREQLLDASRQQLIAIFGPELSKPLSLELQDWAQLPTIATVLDHQVSGGHPVYGYPDALNALWNGQLRFGSTEMAGMFGGYLEGALEAAETTAVYHGALTPPPSIASLF